MNYKVYIFIIVSFLSTAQLSSQSTTDFIHIDQFGYLPSSEKVAVISNPIVGYNSDASYAPGNTLKVVDESNGLEVFSGSISSWNNGSTHDQSGDQGWWFDFSTLTQEGTYYILDETNNTRSYAFEIKENIYFEVLKSATKMFFYNRCNFPKEEVFAGAKWKDGTNFLNPLQDANCRLYTDPANVTLERDLSGGWFDAGDYNKYVTFAHSAVHNLLYAYEEAGEVFTDDMNIPESGNGIPDLLDELTYELNWLEKMINSDGSVILKMGSISYSENGASPPSVNTDPRYYGPTCSSASIATASMFAHAALVYKELPTLSAYAQVLEDKAITCFNYVLPQLQSTTLDFNCDDGTIKSGDADWNQEIQYENALLAAIYLWELTGSNSYHDYIKAKLTDARPIVANWIGNGTNAIVDALINYTTLPGADQAVINEIESSFLPHIQGDWNNFYGMNDVDLYRAYIPTWGYYWGSSQSKAEFANLNILIAKHGFNPSGSQSYLQKAEEMIHYFHGVNPQNLVYLSNMYGLGAEKSVNEIYHTWFGEGTIYDHALNSPSGPAPGFVTGGPNKDYTYSGFSPPYGQPAQKSYFEFNPFTEPQNAWEITEPAIYYQAAYVRMLANFTSRSSCIGPSIVHIDIEMPSGGNGVNWNTAFKNLETALDEGCLEAVDTIKLAEGIYSLAGSDRNTSFNLSGNILLEGGYASGGTSQNSENHITVLSGNLGDSGLEEDNAYHTIFIASSSDVIHLKDLIISGGYANGANQDSKGAGVYNNGTLTLENVRIESNSSQDTSTIIFLNQDATLNLKGINKVQNNNLIDP